MNMSLAKQALRKELLAARKALSPENIIEKRLSITERLLILSCYGSAETILVYIPAHNEVDTLSLISSSWGKGKVILVPVCQPKKELLLSKLESFDHLEKSLFGLREPSWQSLNPVPPVKVDIALIPGVGFDRHGCRLGYGGGYYDRFIPKLRPGCLKIGLAYDFQLLDTIPSDENDIRMDMIITESIFQRT